MAFVVIILPDEADRAVLRGRIRSVATDQEATFTNVAELAHILREMVGQGDDLANGENDGQSGPR